MKILYIGYYRENSDWGRYALNNILMLQKAGFDVVCRALSFSGKETPSEIKHLEKKSIDGCDVCIQHVFPDHLVGTNGFKKNIAIFSNEFITIDHSPWSDTLCQMDQVWVPSQLAKDSLPSKLQEKSVVVPNSFKKEYFTTKHPEIGIPETLNTFKFYSIIDSNSENLEFIVRTFNSEFDRTDGVSLILQLEDVEKTETTRNKIIEIKKSMSGGSIDNFKVEIVIPKVEDRKIIHQIHEYGDCFITPSNQRCLPFCVFEAACFGSTPIIFDNTDAKEYVGEETCVNSTYFITNRSNSSWRDTYSYKNFAINGCEKQTRELMRKLYNEWLENPMCGVEKRKNGIKIADKFSFNTVAKQVKEVINV